MSSREEIMELAKSIACRAGAIELCPEHDESIDRLDDDAKQHAKAHARTVAKKRNWNPAMLVDAVSSVIDDAFMECPSCASSDRDD